LSQKTLSEKAEAFRKLHWRTFVLPNAWDVPSARVFEDAGFPSVATSSAGLMVSLGYQDGEFIDRDLFLAAMKRISKAVSIPLSADIVSGFGESTESITDLARQVIEEIGAIGINIEDFSHGTMKLFSLDMQLQKLRAIRKTFDELGVPVVINARTDALRYAEGDEVAKLNEAIRRAKAFRDSGVIDCVYPMGLTKEDDIARFVSELNFPINVMIRRGLPSLPILRKLDVKRVSFGPAASYAMFGFLKRISRQILDDQDYSGLVEGAISFDELNSLAVPSRSTV
jgi:2-methylisocitrate lyase-like PEP mutase family enzyme